MRVKASNHKDLLAELDIALVSALYRAAGEPDALDNLVATLERRYNSQSPVRGEGLHDALVQELDTIETIVEGQSNSLSRDPLERAVEEVPTAAIVIDPFGKIILTNEYGAELFGARPGQSFDFEIIDPAYRTQFRDFTASARLRGNGRRIILRLDSLGGAEDDDAPGPLQLAEAIIVETTNRDHGCIALRMLDIPWTSTVDLQLQEAFGLTRAECEISRQFYELRDTGAVANHRGTTLATVQTQLKSVSGKTQSASQAQLLQLHLHAVHHRAQAARCDVHLALQRRHADFDQRGRRSFRKQGTDECIGFEKAGPDPARYPSKSTDNHAIWRPDHHDPGSNAGRKSFAER